ncbi:MULTISPECIES: hypothetical protein [unclassified Yoonia]|uniref:hypothetical protein n=1 Tax=unclassified Yoonia TaxID=2629118 RepID=UPI002AFEBF6B|nr:MULTISPECIES: hypothetical protein [unclassified Yoonia]
MSLPCARFCTLATALTIGTAAAAEGTLHLFANGEALAREGFVAPELTRDGWELRFDHVFVTLAGLSALQTDPPFDAAAGGKPAATQTVVFDSIQQVTIDLTDTDAQGRVLLGTAPAPQGHYNAVVWSVVPAQSGDWAGQSMVLIGTATRDGQSVDFTLTSDATHDYVCGEYVGDARKGFVAAGSDADLELTFHLDHVFGRHDLGATDHMNTHALGFDAFAAGGTHEITLTGLHIGHVGEGHCAVSYR